MLKWLLKTKAIDRLRAIGLNDEQIMKCLFRIKTFP